MSKAISAGQSVSIHFRLTLDDGTLLEDTDGKDPVTFRYGAGEMLPALEAQLTGKRVGDACVVELAPADAYGEYDPAAEQTLPRAKFPSDADLQPGSSFQARGPRGEVTCHVLRLDAEDVVITTNHPLAGQRLTFQVRVVDVRAAVPKPADSG